MAFFKTFCVLSVVLFANSVLASELGQDEAEILRKAHKIVGKTLKDPYSAQWEDDFIVLSKDTNGNELRTVCGSVNSKNGFGGYAGAKRYVLIVVATKDVQIEEIYEDAGFNSTIVNGWKNIHDTYKFLPSMIENPGNSQRDTSWSAIRAISNHGKYQSIFETSYWNKLCVDASHPMTFMGE